MSSDVREKMEEAARAVVEYDDVGEYGYGGEITERQEVSNWPEVIDAMLNAYLDRA